MEVACHSRGRRIARNFQDAADSHHIRIQVRILAHDGIERNGNLSAIWLSVSPALTV